MEKEQHSPYFVSVLPGFQPERPTPLYEDYLPPTPQALSLHVQNSGNQSPTRNWCEDSQRNKPQSNSLAAATLIFISGGMSLSWSVGFSAISIELHEISTVNFQICWFLGVIVGACLANIFIETLEKRILNLWASGLIIINGILITSAPGSSAAIVFSRSCNGVAIGLTILTSIVAGSEQAVKRFRGLVLCAESIGIGTGIMFKTILISMWYEDWNVGSNQIQGIVDLIIGSLALVCTCFLTIESPTFFLRREKEEDAINCLKRLQTSSDVSYTYNLLYENRDLLKEDINRGRIENMATSYIPILKLCLYRAFVSMSFSLSLNCGFQWGSSQNVDDPNNNWFSSIYGTLRMLGIVINVFALDIVGRRIPTALAMLIGGRLLIGVGIVFALEENLENENEMQKAIILLIVYQFLSGIAAPASTVYLGEAFSISVKPFFIMVAVIFENVIQIIICCSFNYTAKSVSDFSITVGALQMVFAVCFIFIMPETKGTTLREALTKFKKTLNKFW